jgi:hypothetical protein
MAGSPIVQGLNPLLLYDKGYNNDVIETQLSIYYISSTARFEIAWNFDFKYTYEHFWTCSE